MSLTPHQFAGRRTRERGVSMVEALVALLVMSVGMLGIAGLYVTSLQANRTALLRTQAVTLVNDMLDRIRANPAARAKYDLDKAYAGKPTNKDCVNGAKNCSIDMLAEDDLFRWTEAVKATLPGTPTMQVTVTTGAAGVTDNYLVQVTWTEPAESGSFSYQGTLSILPVQP